MALSKVVQLAPSLQKASQVAVEWCFFVLFLMLMFLGSKGMVPSPQHLWRAFERASCRHTVRC